MAVLVVGLVVGGWPAVEGFVGLLIGAAWWHEVVVAAWYVLARWLRLVPVGGKECAAFHCLRVPAEMWHW